VTVAADPDPFMDLNRQRDFARLRVQSIDRELTALAKERDDHIAKIAVAEHALDVIETGTSSPSAAQREIRLARERLARSDGKD
jgi:hypothetical protein